MLQMLSDKRLYLVTLCCVLLATVPVTLGDETCGEYMANESWLTGLEQAMSDLCSAVGNSLLVMSQTMLCVVVANDIVERLRLMKLNRSQKRALSKKRSTMMVRM